MCMFICPMPHYFQKGLPITRAEDSFVWIWLNLRPLGHPPTWKHELLPKILEWQIASRSYKTDRFTKWSKRRGYFYSLWNLPTYSFWQIPRPYNVSSSLFCILWWPEGSAQPYWFHQVAHQGGVCKKTNLSKAGNSKKNIYLTNKSSQKYYSFISLSVSFMAFGSEMPFLFSTFCDNAIRVMNLNLN